MSRIVLIGGGGFAKEVLEIAELCGHQVIAYVGSKVGIVNLPYWGLKERLLEMREKFDVVCIAFGAIDRKTLGKRAETISWLSDNSLPSIRLVSPRAIIAHGASLAEGAIVAHGAVLSVDCTVGPYCVVNTNAVVGHDAKIGQNVTMAPCSFVAGNVHIHDDTLIGPGCIVLENRTVGTNVIVGMGGTVARNVPDGATVMPLLSKVLKQ